jgi:hypothetical protein
VVRVNEASAAQVAGHRADCALEYEAHFAVAELGELGPGEGAVEKEDVQMGVEAKVGARTLHGGDRARLRGRGRGPLGV